MNACSFPSLVAREWRLLLKDPWLLSLVSWVPILLFLLMWAIFYQGTASNLPIGIVDLDKSRISRALVRHYDSTSTLEVVQSYLNVSEGARALRAGKIYGLVAIPRGLEKMVVIGRPPQVSAFVNTQFLLIGKSVNSALLKAQGTFAGQVEVLKNLATGEPVFDMALSTAAPIGSQITPLFNASNNYAQFLVSAMLPAVWQILMVAVTVLSFAAEQRREGVRQWLSENPIRAFFAKLLPLAIIFSFHGFVFLFIMYILLGWPMHGSWALLIVAQLATVCASLAVAPLFFLVTLSGARGLSLAAAYAAPGLAFMGVTFPVTDMTVPAKMWRSLLPVSHYIEIQLAQVNYGAPMEMAISQLQQLGLFCIPLLLAIYKVRSVASVPVEAEVSQ